jgi:hypothetical protein
MPIISYHAINPNASVASMVEDPSTQQVSTASPELILRRDIFHTSRLKS